MVPKFIGEHYFEPAIYAYQFEQSEAAERMTGVSSNKPRHAEFVTKRDHILTSSWHQVKQLFINYHFLGAMDGIQCNVIDFSCRAIPHLESYLINRKSS